QGKPRVIGLLVEKELQVLNQLLGSPKKPVLGILGGAKVSDKIKFVRKLLEKVDRVLIGGAMAYTFLKAQGQPVGNSLVDDTALARELLDAAGGKIVLPVDHVVAREFKPDAETQRDVPTIPDGWLGMDIGRKTIDQYRGEVAKSATVIWNGPMGKFEWPAFAGGTRAVAEALAERTAAGGTTVVGGGDSADAVEQFGLDTKVSHVSTGGGAFLKYVEQQRFDSLDQIEDR